MAWSPEKPTSQERSVPEDSLTHSEHLHVPHRAGRERGASHSTLWVKITAMNATKLTLWRYLLVWGRLVHSENGMFGEWIFSLLTYSCHLFPLWHMPFPGSFHMLLLLLNLFSPCCWPSRSTLSHTMWKQGSPLSNCHALVISIQTTPFNEWSMLATIVRHP